MAACAALVLARCPTDTFRKGSDDPATFFRAEKNAEGEVVTTNFTEQVGVEARQALPFTGNLYVHRLNRGLNDEDSQKICFSGTPVGFFTSQMCCADEDDAACENFAAAKVGSLIPTERDLLAHTAAGRKVSGEIMVQGNRCNKASKKVARTPEARAVAKPDAIPFEFAAGSSESACSCHAAKPEFHSFNLPVSDGRAIAWATKMTERDGFDLRFKVGEKYKSCAFFQSGYGWDNDNDKQTIVPIIPPRPMGSGITNINFSHVKIPIFGFAGDSFARGESPHLRCSGDATIQEDVNYCISSSAPAPQKPTPIIRPGDVDEISIKCDSYTSQPGALDEYYSRCCMKVSVDFTDGSAPQSGIMIRADIMNYIGCNGVNRAVNNGDGEFHFSTAKGETEEAQFEKRLGGREGTLFRSVFAESLAPFRQRDEDDGFHRVCVAKVPQAPKPEPTCHRLKEINVATDTTANLFELREDVEAIYNFDMNVVGADYDERKKVLLEKNTNSYMIGSRAWFKSCLMPRKDTFGKPVHAKECDATSLYNVHAFNVQKKCEDIEKISPMIRGWALWKNVPEDQALIEWSKMPPSFYSAAGSIPLVPADMLVKDKCLPNADARTFPKDRRRINYFDDLPGGNCTTKQNCCPYNIVTKKFVDDGTGCVDQCDIYRNHLERVSIDLTAEDWKNLWATCSNFDAKNIYFCKLAGQYYTDRGILRLVEGSQNPYTKGDDRHPYCTGTYDAIPGEGDSAVLEDDVDILFVRAGPRTRGVEHPVWEAGGYIGGSGASPGFQYLDRPQNTETDFTQGTEKSNEVPLISPRGSTVSVTTDVAAVVDSITAEGYAAALVADASCFRENHREGQTSDFVAIPGLYPRWLDLSTKDDTVCARLRGTKSPYMQEPLNQPFVDLYHRGGGATNKEDMTPFTLNWDFDNYEFILNTGEKKSLFSGQGEKYFRPHPNGICVAPAPNGCQGFCDIAGRAGAIAATVGEGVAALALIAGDFLTDGALTPEVVAGEKALQAAGKTAKTASKASRMLSAAGGAIKGTARATTKVAKNTLVYGNKGLKTLGLNKKTGLMLGLDFAGTVASGKAAGPDDSGSVSLSHNWRSLLRAQLASNPHPLKQETQQDPNASYFNFPSMIFTCLDGKAECFADPETVSTTKFSTRDKDYWMFEPGMLPTQTLATQLGCHTAFEQDGGKFKADIEALEASTVNTVVYRQRGSDGFPQVKFSVVDSDVVRGITGSYLYYAGDKERTYLPFVPRKLHKCSLCHLYTGYFAKTHRVDECKVLNDANEERHMRYKLDDTTPQDRYGTGFFAQESVDLSKAKEVRLEFTINAQTVERVWKRNANPVNTHEIESGVDVQRLLGINLTHYGSRLTKGACIGDTSSLGSKCFFDSKLRVHPTNKITCVDNTTQYAGACINPLWVNDKRLYFKSSPDFDARAEKVSYCANKFGSTATTLFDDDLYDDVVDGRAQSLYDETRNTYVHCADDLLSDNERKQFCKGSDRALGGSRAAMGLRPTARLTIEQVCDFGRNRCILYPEDPVWTISLVMQELRKRPVEATVELVMVPVNFNVLVNIPLFATIVDTTWFNDPLSADAEAFFEAAAVEPLFQAINVSWGASRILADGFCAAGGPATEDTSTFMALLWAVVELMSPDGKLYSVVSFDSSTATKNAFTNQRLEYAESVVYPDVHEANIRNGAQKIVVRSAFDAETGIRAAQFAPAYAGRFAKARPIKFEGKPISGGDTCTRFFSQATTTFINVEFYQDGPGCQDLAANERAPVVAFGDDVSQSTWIGTRCFGCPVHGLLARGFDTTEESNFLAQDVNVAGTAMVDTTLRLHWRDCGEDVTALECANLDFFAGVSLALARTEGNAAVVGCAAAGTNSRCFAESERDVPFVVSIDQQGQPIESWVEGIRPTACNDTCDFDADTVYCDQAYEWRCVDNTLAAERVFNASNTFGTGNGRILANGTCTEVDAGTTIPLLRRRLLEFYPEKLPPWVGWAGGTTVSFQDPPYEGTTLFVEHDDTLRFGDRFTFDCFSACADITAETACENPCTYDNETCSGGALSQDNCNDVIFHVVGYEFPTEVNESGRLQISRSYNGTAINFDGGGSETTMTGGETGVETQNLTTALIFGTPLVSTRKVADGPCAPEDLAVLSDGALFAEDDVAAQLVQYEAAVTLTHRCSTLGCPGAVDNTDEIPVCRTELPSVDASGFFMWHTFLEIPEAAVFSMPHTTSPGFIRMEYRVKPLSSDAEDALSADRLLGVRLRQLHSVDDETKCLQRVGTEIQSDVCQQGIESQLWLLVPSGMFARIEVPNDPYTCLYAAGGDNLTATDLSLVPCPPCFVGSGPHVVGLADLDATTLPKTDFDPGNGANTGKPDTLLIPISTTEPRGLSVNVTSGLCLCDDSFLFSAYACPCNLANRRSIDLGADCSPAVGMLLASCGKLGAGLAAVNGYKRDMRAACALIRPGTRYNGKLRGRGALFECNAKGDMVHVMDPGTAFADREEIEGLPGLVGVVSKVVMQPYRASYPFIVLAPSALEINVTSLLQPFGDHLHTLAVQGFNSGPTVWLGVIIELTFIFVAVLLQCFLCARPDETRKILENKRLQGSEPNAKEKQN